MLTDVSCEVLAVVLLRIQVYWNVLFCDLSASDIVSHPRRPESQCDDITAHYPLIMYSQGK